MFLEKLSPRDLMMKLNNFGTIFIRGLPRDRQLQHQATARVFSAVLSQGVVTESNFTSQADGDALQQCFRNGWLHTDKLPRVGQPANLAFFRFATPPLVYGMEAVRHSPSNPISSCRHSEVCG